MGLGNVFQSLGFWTNVFVWNEPLLFRVRLRGDLLLRLAMAFGAGLMLSGALLAAFAVNRNPPHPIYAGFGLLLGAGLVVLLTCNGRSTASGKVRICEEGIHRRRFFAAIGPYYGCSEKVSWPYESLRQCVIVPGHAIGQPFSVLVLADEANWELVGVPRRIDLQELGRFLATRGVPVSTSAQLPAHCTRKLNLPLAGGVAFAGTLVFVAAAVFYASHFVGGANQAPPHAPVALREQPPAAIDHFAARPRPGGRVGEAPRGDNGFTPPPVPPPPGPSETTVAAAGPPSLQSGVGTTPVDLAVPAADRAVHAALTQSPEEEAVRHTKTELLGGTGGFPFESDYSAGEAVIGFHYSIGTWAGEVAITHLEPLFDRQAPGTSEQIVIARPGYVVGGLQVDAGDLVSAVRVVFVRENENGELDLEDFYMSEWLGARSRSNPKTLGNGKDRVLGLYGRSGAVLDAVGLVLEQR
jgi:hypothetical protein